MSLIRLAEMAQALPQAWSSQLLARFGDARLKLLRMDDDSYPIESHDDQEGLLVLEGVMQLKLDEGVVPVRAGELYLVPAGTPHAVAAGSRGTLLIVDV